MPNQSESSQPRRRPSSRPSLIARHAALIVASLTVAPALAAVPDADAGLLVPGLTGALADDARAPRENPAGLGFLEGGELQLLHLRSDGSSATGLHLGAGAGMLGVGFGQDWLDGPEIGRQRRSMLSLAIGERAFSMGGSVRWLNTAAEEDSLVSYDLGAAGRMHPRLAWSVRARDLGLTERTSYSVGFGARFLRDRVTVGVDRIWRRDESFLDFDGLVSWGLVVRLLRGAHLTGQIVHPMADPDLDDLLVRLALTLNLSTTGVTLGTGTEGAVWDDGYAAARVSSARHRAIVPRKEQVLINMEEFLSPVEQLVLRAPRRDPFIDLIRLLDQARRDPEIDAVVLRTSGRAMLSFAEVEELQQSTGRLREAGKPVYFFLDGADDWTLYLASGGDRVIAAPSAAFTANGLALTASFLAEGLAKLGIEAEFARAEEYKTAPDTFERSDMSEEQREALEAILDDTWRRYVEGTAEGLAIDGSAVEQALDRGLYTAEVAMEAGLIDEIAYPDELQAILARQGHRPRMAKAYEDRRFADRRWGRPPTIAVIPVTGTIILGETPTGLFRSEGVTGSATVTRAIRRAVDDPSVAAIVVRVDSPGGEAHASDLIWRALREADQRKPVIASMGSLAASGGYYVAAGARHIVANPSTLTGSIGVFAGGVDASGLFEMLGIGRVTLKRGELADMFSLDRSWTDEERAAVQSFVDESYEQFLTRVAEGRDLTREQVEEGARGRIWTGAQAMELNLVDRLGTFQDAVEHAKSHAGIGPSEVVDVSLFTGVNGPLAAFTGRGRPLAALLHEQSPHVGEEILDALGPFLWLQPNVPLALMPLSVDVR